VDEIVPREITTSWKSRRNLSPHGWSPYGRNTLLFLQRPMKPIGDNSSTTVSKRSQVRLRFAREYYIDKRKGVKEMEEHITSHYVAGTTVQHRFKIPFGRSWPSNEVLREKHTSRSGKEIAQIENLFYQKGHEYIPFKRFVEFLTKMVWNISSDTYGDSSSADAKILEFLAMQGFFAQSFPNTSFAESFDGWLISRSK